MEMNVLSLDFKQQRDTASESSVKELPLKSPLRRSETSTRESIDDIYRQYDFKFSSNFKGHENLGLLAFAKPMIQYFIDQLIHELIQEKLDKSAANYNIEALIEGFTLMYLNRLARAAKQTLEFELQFAAQKGELSGNSEADWLRSFAFKIQDKAYVEFLIREYPDLFPKLLQVSRNWVAFVVEFSAKLSQTKAVNEPAG